MTPINPTGGEIHLRIKPHLCECGKPCVWKQLDALQAENERLKKEIKDWLCVKCRTVFNGPPQEGFSCVVCTKCGGDCGPRAWMENRELKAENARLREELSKTALLIINQALSAGENKGKE